MANIVVYNGCTGSLLDGVTRKGKLSQILNGITRDTYSLEATLKFIQANNRENGSNTQVYICGAPDFLGLKISEIINRKLKKIVKKYSNAVYVEPVKSKFLYKSIDVTDTDDLGKLQQFFKKHMPTPDIHYDEEEYLEFNNKIIKSITQNFLSTKGSINIDRNLYQLSRRIEIDDHDLRNNKVVKQQLISNILMAETEKLSDKSQIKQMLMSIQNYLIDRAPYDFHYVGKEEMSNTINEVGRKYD